MEVNKYRQDDADKSRLTHTPHKGEIFSLVLKMIPHTTYENCKIIQWCTFIYFRFQLFLDHRLEWKVLI